VLSRNFCCLYLKFSKCWWKDFDFIIKLLKFNCNRLQWLFIRSIFGLLRSSYPVHTSRNNRSFYYMSFEKFFSDVLCCWLCVHVVVVIPKKRKKQTQSTTGYYDETAAWFLLTAHICWMKLLLIRSFCLKFLPSFLLLPSSGRHTGNYSTNKEAVKHQELSIIVGRLSKLNFYFHFFFFILFDLVKRRDKTFITTSFPLHHFINWIFL
jgi:hypothetical protein